MYRKFIAASMIAVFAFLTGCNTMAGLGRDVEKTGDKLEKKAEEKKHY